MNVYHVFICVFFISIYFCGRARWKNSVTEWFTQYEYIWNENKKQIYIWTMDDFLSDAFMCQSALTI